MLPALDGVRAVAIVPVVLFHTDFSRLLPGGAVGVDLFFVLSGFLITTLLLEERARCGGIGIPAFYARRALRLGPALLLLLAAAWLLSFIPALAESTPSEVARFSLYVLTYTSNWILALQLQHWPALLGHIWSLAVEEQYYLVWPVVLSLLLARGARLRSIAIGLLLLVAGLALWRALLWHQLHDVHRVYFATDTRASGLLFGSVLGVVRESGLRLPARASAVVVACGLLLYGWTIAHVDQQTSSRLLLGLKLVELSAGAMIFALGAGERQPVARWLESAPLVWIGRRSYGIYLWHVPMLYAAYHLLAWGRIGNTLAGVAATIASAALSYRFVERPLLRYKGRFERPARPLQPQAA